MSATDWHNRFVHIEHRLHGMVRAMCLILLAAIVLTISASVTARFVIFTPLNFADPLSKYMMQWMAFLGVGLAIRTGAHVLVDMGVRAYPARAQRAIGLIIAVLVMVLFAIVLRYGLVNAWSARTSSDPFVFGIPMVYPYLSVPVGAAYALVETFLLMAISLTSGGRGTALSDGAAAEGL
ncbi:MAG: TRAP transporter small permease [Tropicimonas sp.]|uniref:TRAP transporter small permease n=1 Tax=Tropicimonas sp. TaxID=2067044 RepID=UPI003A84CB54